RTTVVTRLQALAELGLVSPVGHDASSGGRPATMLAFDLRAKAIIGIDLGATHGTVGVTDLAGRILVEERTELLISDGPAAILDWAVGTAERLSERAGYSPRDVLGIGVGVPGPVEHSTGRPVRPPIMPGWDGFDIPAFVRSRIDAPVLVD